MTLRIHSQKTYAIRNSSHKRNVHSFRKTSYSLGSAPRGKMVYRVHSLPQKSSAAISSHGRILLILFQHVSCILIPCQGRMLRIHTHTHTHKTHLRLGFLATRQKCIYGKDRSLFLREGTACGQLALHFRHRVFITLGGSPDIDYDGECLISTAGINISINHSVAVFFVLVGSSKLPKLAS